MDINNVPSFDSSVTATAETLGASGTYLSFFEVQNPNTVQVFLQLFDALVANVTLGSTAPTMSLLVPPGDGNASGGRAEIFPTPPHFRTGLVYAVTTTATGSTAATSVCGVGFVRN
jgi:hypothetical protein